MNKIKLNVFEIKKNNYMLLPSIKSPFSNYVKGNKNDEIVYGDVYFLPEYKYCYCMLAEIKESAFHFFTMYLWEKETVNSRRKVENIYNFNEFAKKLKAEGKDGYIYLGNIFMTPLSEIYSNLLDIYESYKININEVNCSLSKELFDIFHFKKKYILDTFYVNEYNKNLTDLKVYFPVEDYSLPIYNILLGDKELLEKIKNDDIIYFIELYYNIDYFDKSGEYISLLEFINHECGTLQLEEYNNERNKIESTCIVDNYGSTSLFDFRNNEVLLSKKENKYEGKIVNYLTKVKYNIKKRTEKPSLKKMNEIIYHL